MTVSSEVSWTEVGKYIKQRAFDTFTNDELPVLFYNGSAENIVLVKYKNGDFSFFEESMGNDKKLIDRDLIQNVIKEYVTALQLTECNFIIDRKTSDIIYDSTNETIVDYQLFDDLPPLESGNRFVIVSYDKSKDYATSICYMYSYQGGATALYLRHNTKFLLVPAGVTTYAGEQFVSDLFCAYFRLPDMERQKLEYAIKPERRVSRYTENQLDKLGRFHRKLLVKALIDKEPTRQVGNNVDESKVFGDGAVTLGRIQMDKRVPYFTKMRWVTNNLNVWIPYLHEMTTQFGDLKVTAKDEASLKFLNADVVSAYLGIPIADVKMFYLTGKK